MRKFTDPDQLKNGKQYELAKSIHLCRVEEGVLIDLEDGGQEVITDKKQLNELGFRIRGGDIVIPANTLFTVINHVNGNPVVHFNNIGGTLRIPNKDGKYDYKHTKSLEADLYVDEDLPIYVQDLMPDTGHYLGDDGWRMDKPYYPKNRG